MRDDSLIVLENFPRDVALVMIADQNAPLVTIVLTRADDPLAALLQCDLRHRTAKNIGARVDGIAQYIEHSVVDGQLPLDRTALCAVERMRYADGLLAMPHQYLANAAVLCKFPKDQLDRLTHPKIGVLVEAAAAIAHIADRDR